MLKFFFTLTISALCLLGFAQDPKGVFEKYIGHIAAKEYSEVAKIQTEKANTLWKEGDLDAFASGFKKVVDVLEVHQEAMIRASYDDWTNKTFYLLLRDDVWKLAAPIEVEKTGQYYISFTDGEDPVVLAEADGETDFLYQGTKVDVSYSLSETDLGTLKNNPNAHIMMAGKIVTLTFMAAGDGQQIEKLEGIIKRVVQLARKSDSTTYRFDGWFEGERFGDGKYSVFYEVKK